MLDKLSYYTKRVINNYDDPFWRRQLVQARILEPIQKRMYSDEERTRVMDEDWDNLIVLDACRADLFEDNVDLAMFDSYGRIKSAGSNTTDWSYRNFAGREFGDTVYVAGNPVTPKMAGESFHHIYEAWEEAFDEETHAILPEPLVEIAKEALETYPNKRLIVHFVQPHEPFVPTPDLHYYDWYVPPTMQEEEVEPERPAKAFHALAMGMITKEDVWDGYRQNLEYVMDPVRDLVDYLPNKTVVTSDHGNMFGERAFPIPVKIYGHPTNLYCPELIDVPWATIEGENRRRITDEGVRSESYASDEEREEKLRYLGYID